MMTNYDTWKCTEPGEPEDSLVAPDIAKNTDSWIDDRVRFLAMSSAQTCMMNAVGVHSEFHEAIVDERLTDEQIRKVAKALL